MEDTAVQRGGQVISEDLGIKLEDVTLDMLGRANRCHIEKENTTIIDGSGKKVVEVLNSTNPDVQADIRPALSPPGSKLPLASRNYSSAIEGRAVKTMTLNMTDTRSSN